MIFLITGMHRSGTSLFTNLTENWNATIFGKLLEPDKGNINGYYENIDIVNLHNSILGRNGYSYFFRKTNLSIETREADFQSAREILAPFLKEQNAGDLYCFKDPRASLFLEFWKGVLEPHPFFNIFLVRNPLLVMDSLIRRNTDSIISNDPTVAMTSWYVYNENIWNFYRRNFRNSIIIPIEDYLRNPLPYSDLVSKKSTMQLPAMSMASIFKKDQFKMDAVEWRTMKLALKHPILLTKSFILYRKMISESRRDFFQTT